MERSTFSEQASAIGRIGARLTVAAFILIVPLSALLYLYINQLLEEQQQAKTEIQAVALISELSQLNWYHLQRFYLEKNEDLPIKRAIDYQQLRKQINLRINNHLNELQPHWHSIEQSIESQTTLSLADFLQQNNDLILETAEISHLAGDTTGKIRIDSQAISEDFPELQRRLFLLTENAISLNQQSASNINNAVSNLHAESSALASLSTKFYSSTNTMPELFSQIDKFVEIQKRLAFIGILGQELQWDINPQKNINDLRLATHNALANLLDQQFIISQSIHQHLLNNLDKINQNRNITIATVLLLIVAALFLGYYIVKSIRYSQEYLEKQNDTLEAIINERTEDLQKEKQFAETLNSELHEKSALANRLAEKAEAASKAKTLFLASMSHEIRTPLNALIGGTTLLKKTNLDSEQSALLELVHTSGKTLLDLVSDILDFSKIEANELALEQIDFDLEKIISDLLKIFSLKAQEKGINLDWEFDTHCMGSWKGDPTRIKQIIMNLLSNAIKFTAQGYVRCSIYQANELTICIEDTGIGMEADSIDTLFDAFTQSDTTITRKFGGSGLGLSITKRLTELMGGRIEVESTPDAGSSFNILLPLPHHYNPPPTLDNTRILVAGECSDLTARLKHTGAIITCCRLQFDLIDIINQFKPDIIIAASWGANAKSILSMITEKASTPILEVYRYNPHPLGNNTPTDNLSYYDTNATLINKILRLLDQPYDANQIETEAAPIDLHQGSFSGHILLVEDVEFNRIIAKEFLADLGLHISEAHNGEEAVAMHQKLSFDLILMDLHMPVLDGISATRKIRRHEQLNNAPPTPIIAMTADVTKDAQEQIVQCGMNGYLSKPFEEASLINLLDQHLVSTQTQSKPVHTPTDESGDNVETFDYGALSKRLKHRLDRISYMVSSFTGHLDESITAIETAFLDGDRDNLLLHSHSLKGSAANLGALNISHLAANIEQATKSHEDVESIPEWIEQLKQEQPKFIEAANRALNNPKASGE